MLFSTRSPIWRVLAVAALLDAVATGQDVRDRLQSLFRQHYGAVIAFLRRQGASREEAEDVAQETFLRAYRQLSGFRGDSSPKTWLLAIAGNRWRNHLRDRSAAKRQADERPLEGVVAETVAAADASAAESLIQDERRAALRRAIVGLPPGMRQSVWLRVYQDMSYREISDVLDVGVASAKSQVSLAKGKLRRQLSGHYPELDALDAPPGEVEP